MTDRPINLDARDVAGRMGSHADLARGRQQRQPTPQETQRFAQALKGEDTAAASSPSTPGDSIEPGKPSSSFPVFTGLIGSVNKATDPVVVRRMDELQQDLGRMVSRLLVGDGSSSAAGRQLMLDLSDEVLPGVTVSVFEDAGAWVAEFRCREEAPFILLAEQAPSMAARMAQRLGTDAVWRVVADGLTPGGAWDRMVNNKSDGLPSTEAFATCAHPRR